MNDQNQDNFTWIGEKSRTLKLSRPCDCGCDLRDKPEDFIGVGYLSGSDQEGNGFSLWIHDEDVFYNIEHF